MRPVSCGRYGPAALERSSRPCRLREPRVRRDAAAVRRRPSMRPSLRGRARPRRASPGQSSVGRRRVSPPSGVVGRRRAGPPSGARGDDSAGGVRAAAGGRHSIPPIGSAGRQRALRWRHAFPPVLPSDLFTARGVHADVRLRRSDGGARSARLSRRAAQLRPLRPPRLEDKRAGGMDDGHTGANRSAGSDRALTRVAPPRG